MLRSEIYSGAFAGGLLPSEPALMLRYDARRAAVRRALSMLRDEGLLDRVQGLGTFAVADRYIADMGELHAETDNADNWIGPQVRSLVLERTVLPAPAHVARRLDLAHGEEVLRVEYIGHVNRQPMALATNYVAFPEAEALLETPFMADWYTFLNDAGIGVGGTEWVLCAVNADEVVADHLEVAQGTALILGEEMVWDEQERPFNFAVVYIRTDRYAFASKSWSIGGRHGEPPLATTMPPRVNPRAGVLS
jgi:GntR family transcriptional regulator